MSSDLPITTETRPVSRWRWLIRIVWIILGLCAWFYTQSLIQTRPFTGGIGDRLLDWLGGGNSYLLAHTQVANALLISSSLVIDALGVFLLLRSIFGPSMRPFIGLVMLFGLRQICQGLCALPIPEGMIWRSPGFPSLLVTYGVSNDLFFSGHTAIAVFGATEIARMRGWGWKVAGILIVLFEAGTVLMLRAHWTMDVFTGAVTALWVACAVGWMERKWNKQVT